MIRPALKIDQGPPSDAGSSCPLPEATPANTEQTAIAAGALAAGALAGSTLGALGVVLVGLVKAGAIDAEEMRDWLTANIHGLPPQAQQSPFAQCIAHLIKTLGIYAMARPSAEPRPPLSS